MDKRKAFNFYRSYYATALKLPEKDRLQYLMAIMELQFTGECSIKLDVMADLALESNLHNINKQIEGYKHGAKSTKQSDPPRVGVPIPPKGTSPQVQVQGEVQEKEELYKFEEFWKQYPKKVAKSKCEHKYKKLSTLDKQKIHDTIKTFVSYKPFKDYTHPNPMTYLNQKRWEDEIPELKQQKKSVADLQFESVMAQIEANKQLKQ